MLIQIKFNEIRVNVYIESGKGFIIDKLTREDREFVRVKVTQCVVALLEKYAIMYGERS